MTTQTLPLRVTVDKTGRGRNARYTARFGDLEADGPTAATARADLAEQILMAATEPAPPAFARDDDGTLIVALTSIYGAVNTWRVASTARLNTIGGQETPDEHLAAIHHFTPIPRT